jgi:hypothetical protein
MKPVEERFWEKVDRRGPADCWNWTAGTVGQGNAERGIFWMNGRNEIASRASMTLAGKTTLDSPLLVLHSCDNGLCVNPAHLFLGTHKDNSQDCAAKGRLGQQKRTHCLRGHPRTPENTYTFHGSGSKVCGICRKINSRNWDAKMKARRAGATNKPTESMQS